MVASWQMIIGLEIVLWAKLMTICKAVVIVALNMFPTDIFMNNLTSIFLMAADIVIQTNTSCKTLYTQHNNPKYKFQFTNFVHIYLGIMGTDKLILLPLTALHFHEMMAFYILE